MRCDPSLLGAFVDGELPGWQRWQLQRHLTRCSHCRAELAELRALAALVGTLSPLPAPTTIHRPIGLARPAVSLLAMACAVGFFLRGAGPELSRQAPVRLPKPPVIQANAGPVVRPAPVREAVTLPPRRVARHKKRRLTVAHARAKQPAEQVIVIATVLPPPEPVTVVLDDRDDDGGTIHIESTIPAAYVVALQKESE